MSVKGSGADAPFLGFLFQIERVIFWLSQGEGTVVELETDDDVVVRLVKGEKIDSIYEQNKNAQKNRIPFSDQSEDLWKTLANWCDSIDNKVIDINSATLAAVTNKMLPSNRLILRLSQASINGGSSKDALKELRLVGLKINGEAKKYAEKVISHNDDFLEQLIDKIFFLNGDYHHDTISLKKKIRENLSVGDKLPFEHIFNGLVGAVVTNVVESWRNNEKARLHTDKFNNLYNQLVADYSKKPFIERATELLPVTKNEVKYNRNNLYVKQLKAIGCNDQELLEAIHDFLRANSEKGRYAKEFEVMEDKFTAYYKDLEENWKAIHRPSAKINSLKLSDENLGYEIYYKVIVYKGKLNNYEPEQSYTYKGAYHYLANQPTIGWHPNWETKFKK